MLIEKLISPLVPTLLPTDTGNTALHIMEENNFTQLPIVSDQQYLALINENEVMDWNTPESPLSASAMMQYRPAVFAKGHPYEALRIAHEYNLSIVPVIDEQNIYIGSITKDELLKYITETSGIDNPGGIIVLELSARGYSLMEIARICENEEVTIISTQLFNNRFTGKLEITLKTNRNNLRSVVSSFERHNYVVKEVFGDQSLEEDVMTRYKILMNYINL